MPTRVTILVFLLVLTQRAGAAENFASPPLLTGSGPHQGTWLRVPPEWTQAAARFSPRRNGLLVRAGATPHSVGIIQRTVPIPERGAWYRVEAHGRARDLERPEASLRVRVTWLKQGSPTHPAGCLVRGPFGQQPNLAFSDVVHAPSEADAARISLEVVWPGGGSVRWQEVRFQTAPAPTPRKLRVGTVYLRPRQSTPDRNLDLWCEQIDTAGRMGLDIVCLSEAIRSPGTTAGLKELAEPIPGPSTTRLGEAAHRNKLWVVAGLYEMHSGTAYNTAVLIDRSGAVAGTYRKVHLPREEWQRGFTPGDHFPVFETEIGRIGMMVCYDYFYPEAALALAGNGAEIVFAPTWGTTFQDTDGRVEGRTILRVRARDAGIPLVTSVYDGDSLIIDAMGRVLASSDGATGVFQAEVNLDAREPLAWVGEWPSIRPRDRMPSTYPRP